MQLADGQIPRPGIEEKVAFLSKPGTYPDGPRNVEVKQTHMSWVFLTDLHAWKLKKPVCSAYLDFSTSEARRRNCEDEVRLNRRLAPDVYYGVVPLTQDAAGKLQLHGEGQPVDWLVHMRKLPADRMLDRMIADKTVTHDDARRAASLLARFYARAVRFPTTGIQYRRRLKNDLRAVEHELKKPEYGLPAEAVEAVIRLRLEFLKRSADLLYQRVREGRIVEAHGDLRPEHICLQDEAAIIDCLEFNRELRMLDAASELSFLALECDRLGAPAIGETFLKTYSESTGDSPPAGLLAFYRAYHACMRARVAAWHLKDHDVRDAEKWRAKALHYLQMAGA